MRAEQNHTLTHVGPNTPMGNVFRHFWIPALLSEELPAPDCAPVRVTLLGEKLVAFRDTQGRVGLLDAQCPHRRAELFFGRNECGGLRCVYHGWKFDVEGRCVDMPSEPPGSPMRQRMRTLAYPVVEHGGMVWAYMGPQGTGAKPPSLDFADVPAEHRYVSKCIMRCNYLQALEGSIDTAHLSFLHRTLTANMAASQVLGIGGNLVAYSDQDGSPRFFVEPTEYGLSIAARRNADEENYYWRITQWLMPFGCLIPTDRQLVSRTNFFVPIDDESCWFYRIRWHPTRPLTASEVSSYQSDGMDYPEMIPGTYFPKGNRDNDYLIDRVAQRESSFTGIRSVQLQDIAIQESQGAVHDRTKENLGTTDLAIVQCRRALLRAAADLEQKGIVPEGTRKPEAYRVSAIAVTLPKDKDPLMLKGELTGPRVPMPST